MAMPVNWRSRESRRTFTMKDKAMPTLQQFRRRGTHRFVQRIHPAYMQVLGMGSTGVGDESMELTGVLEANSSDESMELPVHVGQAVRLQAFSEQEAARLEASNFAKVGRHLIFTRKDWMLTHHYAVTVAGRLQGVEGLNGELWIMEFTYRGSHVAGGVPYEGRALHKASPKDEAASEPAFTRQMSETLGFSVGFVGSAQDRQRVHMLTEYVPSSDVFTVLDTHKRIPAFADPWMQAFALGQLIYTLKLWQEHGIVHRDAKTENMIVRQECLQFLLTRSTVQNWVSSKCALIFIDYGLACREGSKSATPEIGCEVDDRTVGTEAYMPPEAVYPPSSAKVGQAAVEFRPWTHLGDVFSMGVVGLEVLTFFSPLGLRASQWTMSGFSKDDVVAKCRAAMLETTFLTEVQSQLRKYGISAVVQNVIIRMLNPQRHLRPDANSLWEESWLHPVREQIIQISSAILESRAMRVYLSG